nr:hypothetical protein Q903MT_gene5196 [Picea sitchensis]
MSTSLSFHIEGFAFAFAFAFNEVAFAFASTLLAFAFAFVIRLKADSTRAPFPLPWRILPFTLENAHLRLFCCLVNGLSSTLFLYHLHLS